MVGEAEREYAEDYWRAVVLDLTPDTLVQWHLGNTENSCETCSSMAELGPMLVSEFVERDTYPQSHELDCHGYNCRCFLTVIERPDADIDQLLSDLGQAEQVGNADLAAFYDAVHAQIIAESHTFAGLTPASAGKSWFDAPASSAGSFTGERYIGTSEPLTTGQAQWAEVL